jgi:hypothetical protein
VLALVDALCIPVLAVPGVEADDVVGTLATKAEQDGFGSVVIMSSDKVREQERLGIACSLMHQTQLHAGGMHADCILAWQQCAVLTMVSAILWCLDPRPQNDHASFHARRSQQIAASRLVDLAGGVLPCATPCAGLLSAAEPVRVRAAWRAV